VYNVVIAIPCSTVASLPFTRTMQRASKHAIHCIENVMRPACSRSYYYTPMVIERVLGGERTMDIWSLLLQKRLIFLHGEVTEDKSNSIVAQLLYLESTNPEDPVEMYIDSPGGSVTAGLAIYDTMEYINPPVHTFVTGQASSMGSLLLSAGAPGKRHSLPHSRIMLHQPLGGASGQASDVLIQAQEMKKTKDTIIDIYSKTTGKSKEELERLLDRDHWLTPPEAVEFGILDTILRKREWEKT
jgi:ATP-dependent Clp protease, protease subunit